MGDLKTTNLSTGGRSAGARKALLSTVALLAIVAYFTLADDSAMPKSGRNLGGGKSGGHPHYAIIFPVISLLVGVILHYFLGRFLHHAFPFTAAMFVFGIIMGTTVSKFPENQVTESFQMWAKIDGHLLIMVFLPGLLFRDAYCQDVFLFCKGFWQCALLAFPCVLAGTALTACVLTYVFPYFQPALEQGQGGDIFIYSMVLGSILSATDPVAVSALLNEVGAPPRLRTHVAGESLLNDGAAVVFFNIFYNMDLYKYTGGLRGQSYDLSSGIVYFIKLSLGSAGLGIALGLVLAVCLWVLNHRYSYEENVVQVMTTLAFAYLSFYLSESILHMSGIICVVFCSLVVKGVADSTINDQVAMNKFWDLLEHILNTVLFTLGGLIWGTVIVNDRALTSGYKFIEARDWGYLFALYFFLILIRSVLVAGVYPIMKKIGLKTNWQESVFMAWGGLRGAVGIALGILVENAWLNVDEDEIVFEGDYESALDGYSKKAAVTYLANLWFFFAGGIAFLTLIINGTTAGPLLKKLGLAASTSTRESIVERYRTSMHLNAIDQFIKSLANPLFYSVDFAVIQKLVPGLKNITASDIVDALRRNISRKGALPNIMSLEPFFSPEEFIEMKEFAFDTSEKRVDDDLDGLLDISSIENKDNKGQIIEYRKVFIALLQRAYIDLIEKGSLDPRAGDLIAFKLFSSLEATGDLVAQGEPIADWENCQNFFATKMINKGRHWAKEKNLVEYGEIKATIPRAVACIIAHKMAQESFKLEFGKEKEMSPIEKLIIAESNAQIKLANDDINQSKPEDISNIKTRLLCNILLNEQVQDVFAYFERGLLLKTEAEHIVHHLEDKILDLQPISERDEE